MRSVIEVSAVSKTFYNDPLWRRIVRWVMRSQITQSSHDVLREISFSVRQGEAIGIVGVNGAGKSTLLKLLVGTLAPSSGQIAITGHLSAILELGMGLNELLSARHNAQLSLAMHGVTAEESERLIPWIHAFSELGEYFDEPVRVLSSGMTMRLAFSIATSIRPDILIIDEALAVGDAYFQHKCADHIRQLKNEGTTLLFVSHDMSAMQALCDRAILLDQGQVAADGETSEVLSLYNALLAPDARMNSESRAKLNQSSGGIESGTRLAEIVDYRLMPLNDQLLRPDGGDGYWIGEQVELQVRIKLHQPLHHLVVGFLLLDRLGQQVFGTNTYYLGQESGVLDPTHICRCDFRFPLNLGVGSYSLTLALTPDESHLSENYHWIDRALVFEVFRTEALPYTIGAAYLPVAASMTAVDV